MNGIENTMSDQCVISSEFNLEFDQKKSYIIVPVTKLWVAVDAVTRVFLPTVFRFCYTVSRSFTSVQNIASSMPVKIAKEPKLMVEATEPDTSYEGTPEKCVTCQVLTEPEGNVRADVVFVHGLHGGLDRTWKQGTWRSDDKNNSFSTREQSSTIHELDSRVNTQSSTLKRTLNHIYSKIPRKISKKEDHTQFTSDIVESAKQYCEEYTNCWPQDWLPLDCPDTRVIALNYTTDVLWCPIWQKQKNRTNLVERSKEMIEELLKHGVGNRPIIWVGHSKGGLFIKQMLLNAYDLHHQNDVTGKLYHQTKGIMFYSVPHKGSSVADLQFPLFRRSIELLEIQRNCDYVLNLHQKFLEIFSDENENKPEIFSFIDTVYTRMGFMNIEMIAYESADPEIGHKRAVPLNHRDICKPSGRDCLLYLELVQLIQRSVSKELQLRNS
ncbi:protein SERAC1 isoform X2 [Cylas formicarius]|uniref:protein SERAC1 isoform X2 n=1 Tax=Cylas formicarius TaxID=197179 RepID=UPI0029584B16|nr:protein SERAC1 isoform X2 [Cylas formicarius]